MLLGGIGVISLVLTVLFALGGSFWYPAAYFAVCYVALFALAVVFLVISCAVVDVSKPQLHDSKFYRAVMYLYIDALITLVRLRVQTSGLEKIPDSGRFLLVCNHQNDADPGVIHSYFKKSQLAFISKQENMRLPFVNKFMHKTMCQMVNRENDREALKTIVNCIRLLKDDEVSVAVFPEGYTSRDGKLHPFRAGTLKIAQKANVPIVVCTINGTRELFHNLKHFKPTNAALHVLGSIDAEIVKNTNTVELGKQIYEMMISDLGEDFRMQA